ncbi:hypothetical protein Nepgr_008054 [Nepenthes gracilis]|uniref:Uncharacterized protein n=1 Tax=Nepenthes gracilis TaxID=150966 RepID=A0AAD3S879_NEPGR|nr:hypothetical protein Nepgr_008054 [Nepenthes gracilis]
MLTAASPKSGSEDPECTKALNSAIQSQNYSSVKNLEGDSPTVMSGAQCRQGPLFKDANHKPSWPITDEDRVAALGPVGASIMLKPPPPVDAEADLESAPSFLPPESELVRGPVASPPRPLDYELDPNNTPTSISRITMKYSLDTSNHLGHESSSPSGLLAASSTSSHQDVPDVTYIATEAATS